MEKNEYSSDDELIALIRKGDDNALTVLYKLYFYSVNHFVITNSGNEHDAKDIFQEAVIVFYEKVKNKDFTLNCKIKTYLYSVSRLIWLKKLKNTSWIAGNMKDTDEYFEIEQEDGNEMEEKELLYGKMASALLQLGEPCKTLIEDFYVTQLSMQDISDKFGYTNSDNAKTQKYKCLMRLKKLFFKGEELIIK